MRRSYPAAALCLSALTLASAGAQNPAPPPASSLEKRVAAVLPTAEEERWLKIPWRTDLSQALEDSRRTGKPVMLWVMNGNPLGCA